MMQKAWFLNSLGPVGSWRLSDYLKPINFIVNLILFFRAFFFHVNVAEHLKFQKVGTLSSLQNRLYKLF